MSATPHAATASALSLSPYLPSPGLEQRDNGATTIADDNNNNNIPRKPSSFADNFIMEAKMKERAKSRKKKSILLKQQCVDLRRSGILAVCLLVVVSLGI